jgi:hypothetical protein
MVTACYNVIVIAKIIRNNVTKMRELVDIFNWSITDEKRTMLEIGAQPFASARQSHKTFALNSIKGNTKLMSKVITGR